MIIPEDTIHVQQLFVKHQSAVKAFVLSLVPHFGEAEDVLQETFLTLTEKASDFQRGTNFVAWACAIARLKVLKAQHRGALRTFSPEVVEALTLSMPEEALSDRRLQALSECMGRLSPRMRELMELRYHREQLPSEISRGLACSLNYVNVALAKARTSLRQCIERSLRRHENA